MDDAHVKSPFYMDSGIQGFRNCELFKDITIISTLESGQITTFCETIIFGYLQNKVVRKQTLVEDPVDLYGEPWNPWTLFSN